jgi:hypothetical protein
LGPSKFLPSSEPPPERIWILPPLPSVRSFAITAPMVSPSRADFETNYEKVQQEFERGWSRGIHRIISIINRMRPTWVRKGSVHRLVELERNYLDLEDTTDVMYGLEPIKSLDDFIIVPPPAPVLCVVGPGKAHHHPKGCPHRVAWEAWQDEL